MPGSPLLCFAVTILRFIPNLGTLMHITKQSLFRSQLHACSLTISFVPNYLPSQITPLYGIYPQCKSPRVQLHKTTHQSQWRSGVVREPQWPSSEEGQHRGMSGHTLLLVGGDETCQSQTLSRSSRLPPEHCDRPSHDALYPDQIDSPEKKQNICSQ